MRRYVGEAKPIVNGMVLALMVAAAVCGTDVAAHAGTSPVLPRPVPTVPVPAAQLKRVPLATTATRLQGVSRDPHPFETESGLVAHPTNSQVIYARPGGPPVAVLPTTELGGPTWVPVVAARPGWEQILLPSRPNRSIGWVQAGSGLRNAFSTYRIHVVLRSHTLTVSDAGHSRGSWKVAIGARSTPTPAGRTFLLALEAPAHPTYSPLILPLGTHSATLDSYGGGPGTVALHGWPDGKVFGHAVSHGCVRVPAAALRVLSHIPLGTPVMITA